MGNITGYNIRPIVFFNKIHFSTCDTSGPGLRDSIARVSPTPKGACPFSATSRSKSIDFRAQNFARIFHFNIESQSWRGRSAFLNRFLASKNRGYLEEVNDTRLFRLLFLLSTWTSFRKCPRISLLDEILFPKDWKILKDCILHFYFCFRFYSRILLPLYRNLHSFDKYWNNWSPDEKRKKG